MQLQLLSNRGAPLPPPIPRELDTSLEPKETNPIGDDHAAPGTIALLQTPECTFRHEGWAKTRTLTHQALKSTYALTDRPDRFARCGSNAWVFRDPLNPDLHVIKATYCHDRWCKPCQAHRSHLIRANLQAHAEGRNLRFLTLTVQHAGRTLAQGVDHLLSSFARLRQSRTWKARCAGGVALLEVKRSRKTAQWHPHLHCLVEGTFISQSNLSSLWLATTKDSSIVDIRRVGSLNQLSKYVTKYVTKPASATVYKSADDLQEAILALHGRRMLITFGTWYGVNFLRSDSSIQWIPVDSLTSLINKARTGDFMALHILAQLKGNQECQTVQERPPPGTASFDSRSSLTAPSAAAPST